MSKEISTTTFSLPTDNMSWLSYQARQEKTSVKAILNRLVVQYHHDLQSINPNQPPVVES